jgi:hypothetical protein
MGKLFLTMGESVSNLLPKDRFTARMPGGAANAQVVRIFANMARRK